MNFPLRLIHPEHGATHVYNALELDKHEKWGWKPEGLEPPKVEGVAAEQREEKKRGRPRKV